MIEHNEYCTDLKNRIEAAYEESGNTLGWRLLYSPAHVLDGADIAFIGLNPGGSIRHPDQAEFSMPQGSAYVVETWDGAADPGENPLQKQIRTLFQKLRVEPDQVLAGNLVPFRSPSWNCLENPDFSLQFGERLWADILQRARPKLVIGMGRELTSPLFRILGAGHEVSVPVDWGSVSALRATFPGGSLVVLPHLSRFGIITRDKSAVALQRLFGAYWHT